MSDHYHRLISNQEKNALSLLKRLKKYFNGDSTGAETVVIFSNGDLIYLLKQIKLVFHVSPTALTCFAIMSLLCICS